MVLDREGYKKAFLESAIMTEKPVNCPSNSWSRSAQFERQHRSRLLEAVSRSLQNCGGGFLPFTWHKASSQLCSATDAVDTIFISYKTLGALDSEERSGDSRLENVIACVDIIAWKSCSWGLHLGQWLTSFLVDENLCSVSPFNASDTLFYTSVG